MAERASSALRSAQDECSISGVLLLVLPIAVHEVADAQAILVSEPVAPGAGG
jgi:hypothetical protein